jgi:soluble lytic murein transglycosylase-like protein
MPLERSRRLVVTFVLLPWFGAAGAAMATDDPWAAVCSEHALPAPAAVAVGAGLAAPAPAPAGDGRTAVAPPAAAVATAAPKPPPPEPPPLLGFDGALGIPTTPFGKLIYQIASRHGLNPHLVAAMVEVESAFQPGAVSRRGACGLMQLLPATARRFGLKKREIFSPVKNLEAGVRYLKWLVDRFGGDPVRVLAAYNAGEGAVERFGGAPPYPETQEYLRRIFTSLGFGQALERLGLMPAMSSSAAAAP